MPSSAVGRVLDALAARFGERLSTKAADLDAASHDASSEAAHRPDAVVWPLGTDDVVEIVRACAAARVPLTPRAAGSSLEGNPIPVCGGLVLDCSRMTRVIAVRGADLQVDV